MASWVVQETFGRVATQPGSTAKRWNKEELIRCRATGTGITAELNLKGEAHPVFADWVDVKPELLKELKQPILLASKILKAAGLPWLSDFLIDDIFDQHYPGRERTGFSTPGFVRGRGVTPHSIVRHHRNPSTPREKQKKWIRSTRDLIRDELPKMIQWQIDEDMFQQKGWNGYTCKHPRGNLPLHEIDKYGTIKKFDSLSLHESSRNLTILVMAEKPARLAELRRQGKEQSEEYLITAFMTTVTILHELGHAIYWRDRRSLTRDLREPFYGADLEIELGDSFIAAIFGGWIPVPVRDRSRLRKDFSFADGIAWRQALNWDHHRLRPKYRAHYSIPVDYIARLFTEASWSTATDGGESLIRPQFLTGKSIALWTVGLHTPLTRANQHATAAIADFQCAGAGWVWNRRPGAWFRIPQYDGSMYPELELPTAGENALREPAARDSAMAETTRDPKPSTPPPTEERYGTAVFMKLSPRKSEYSPRKFALVSPTAKISQAAAASASQGSLVPRCGGRGAASQSQSRKRARAKTLPLTRDKTCRAGQLQGHEQQRVGVRESPTTLSLRQDDRDQKRQRQRQLQQGVKHAGKSLWSPRVQRDKEIGDIDHGEISVDELKKRLSQLIGVSLTELEKLFEGPQSRPVSLD
ncbi:hypothetical protein F4777DRAFT_550349 [Nemania sp. FL0916]|nr:hypothetical protein F4777DRAFT_550349 [Nemania sp. FL0916]